jgi:hypothetical protein
MNCDFCKTETAKWKCGHCNKRYYCGTKCQTKDFNFHIGAMLPKYFFSRKREFTNLLTGNIDTINILVYGDPSFVGRGYYYLSRASPDKNTNELYVNIGGENFPKSSDEQDDFVDGEVTDWIVSYTENENPVYQVYTPNKNVSKKIKE